MRRRRGPTRPAGRSRCTPPRRPGGWRPCGRPTHHGCYRRTSKPPRLASVGSSLTGDLGDYCPDRECGVRPLGRSLIEERRVSPEQTTIPRLASLADDLARAESAHELRLRVPLEARRSSSRWSRWSRSWQCEGVTQVFNRNGLPSDRGLGAARRTRSGRGHPHGSRPIRPRRPPPRGAPPVHRRVPARGEPPGRPRVTAPGDRGDRPRWDARTLVRRPPCRCSSTRVAAPSSPRPRARTQDGSRSNRWAVGARVIVHEPARLRAL